MCMRASMIPPTYRYSVSSPMPFDLNEDQSHQLFTTNQNHNLPSSSSSLSYPILFNPDKDQGGSYCWEEPKHLQSDGEAEKIIPSSGSCWDNPEAGKDESNSDLKLKVWKKKDGNENLQAEDGSVTWKPSKTRMMVPDQRGFATASNSKNKFEEPKQPLSPLGTDDNSSNNSSNHSNITVRVCSDCYTTKTPLWRSGPRGPKSLCNACGIRQRKARRAMAAAAAAAAASADGTIVMAADTSDGVKRKKLHKKEKKLKAECAPQMKKKRKLGTKPSRGRKKFGFEDLTISLSKNLALQVFPQDEKEAAILLMALSHGLLHGFPSDRYLDL